MIYALLCTSYSSAERFIFKERWNGGGERAVGDLRFKSCMHLPGERLPAVLSRIPSRRGGQKGRRSDVLWVPQNVLNGHNPPRQASSLFIDWGWEEGSVVIWQWFLGEKWEGTDHKAFIPSWKDLGHYHDSLDKVDMWRVEGSPWVLSLRAWRVHWKSSQIDFLIMGWHSSVCPASAQAPSAGEEGTSSSSLSVPWRVYFGTTLMGVDFYRHFQWILRLLRSYMKIGTDEWCQSICLKNF